MAELLSPAENMSRSKEKEALIAELEAQRSRVGDDLGGLGDSLDFQQRFRDSVREHPGWWVGGGLAAGMILSRLMLTSRPRKKGKDDPKKAGLRPSPAFFGLLGIAAKEIIRLSTPTLKQVASEQLEKWINERRHPSRETGAEPQEITEEDPINHV